MDKDQFCACGNPRPMREVEGKYGKFMSCDDRQCGLFQKVGEEGVIAGSINTQRPPPEPPPEMVLHSKKQGYAMRRQWHEKHGIPFPESTQDLTAHLASKK